MNNNEMVNQTVNTAEQTVNTTEQTVNTAEQTENTAERQTDTAERQTDTAEQQTDAAEQTENAVEMRDQMLHQSVTKGQWHYCFHTACPQASTCFRQISTKYIPEDSVVGNAIFPTAYKSNGCRFYVTPTISTLSWGFSRLFDNVPHKSVMQLRNDMKRYFRGSSNYYKYHRGEKTPDKSRPALDCHEAKGTLTYPSHLHTLSRGVQFMVNSTPLFAFSPLKPPFGASLSALPTNIFQPTFHHILPLRIFHSLQK